MPFIKNVVEARCGGICTSVCVKKGAESLTLTSGLWGKLMVLKNIQICETILFTFLSFITLKCLSAFFSHLYVIGLINCVILAI